MAQKIAKDPFASIREKQEREIKKLQQEKLKNIGKEKPKSLIPEIPAKKPPLEPSLPQKIADIAFNRVPSAVAGGLKGYAADEKAGRLNPYSLLGLGPTGRENVVKAVTGKERFKFEDWLEEGGMKEGTGREIIGGLLDVLVNPIVPAALKGGLGWVGKLTPNAPRLAKNALGVGLGGAAYEAGTTFGKGEPVSEAVKHGAEGALFWGGTELGLGLVGKGIGKVKNRGKVETELELSPEELDALFSTDVKVADDIVDGTYSWKAPEKPIMALPEGKGEVYSNIPNFELPTPYQTMRALETQKPKALMPSETPLALGEGINFDIPTPYDTFRALEGQKPRMLTPGQDNPLMLSEGYTPNWETGTGYPREGTWFADPYGNIRNTPGMPKELPEGTNIGSVRGNIDESFVPRSDIGDPVYLSNLEKQYNDMIKNEVALLKDEIQGVTKYRPVEDGPLLRASENPQWYREFWAKNGRAPREGEYRNMAINNLIEGNKYTGEPASEEFLAILSELSRGQKLPEEWHGLQNSLRQIGNDPALAELSVEMRSAQKEIEPFGLNKNLDRLTELENQARQRLQDRMDFREQYPNAIGIKAQNPLDDITDFAIIGAAKLARKGMEFKQWAEEMIAEFGEMISNKIQEVWELAQAILKDESGRIGKPDSTAQQASQPAQSSMNKMAEIVTATAERMPKGLSYESFRSEMLSQFPNVEKALPYMWKQAQQLSKEGNAELKLGDTVIPLKPSKPISKPLTAETKTNKMESSQQPIGKYSDYNTAQSIKSVSELERNINIPESIKQVYRKTVDRFNVLNDVDRYLQKRTGKKLSDKDKLYLQGTNSTSAGGIAQQITEVHMLDAQGNVVGESFGAVIGRAADLVGKGNWKVFEDYNKLKHAMSWMRQGRDVYPAEAGLGEPVKRIEETLKQIERVKKDKSLTKEQKAHVVEQLETGIDMVANEIEKGFINPRLSKLEKQFPGIEQAGREYSDWITKFGEEWGVKTGLISPEEWAALRQQYPDYVPLQRVMDEIEEGLMGAGSGFTGQKKPIKTGRGSDRDTLESIEIMIERIPQYVKTAKRNEVAQILYKMMNKYPDEMADAWGKIVKVKPGDPHKPNVVTARVNGKEVSMELTDPALLDAMEHLSKTGQGIVVEAARQATSIMKTLTTGVNPFFAVGRNVFYDTPQAYVNSKSLERIGGVVNNPIQFSVDLLDSLVRLITNDKWHPWSKENYLQMYRDMGGGQFTSASAADRNLIAESKAKLLPDYIDASKPLTSAGRLTKKGYGGLQRLMSTTETLPRLPEFKREVMKGGGSYESKVKGLYEANDITFNFSRSGDISKTLDAFIPYFNAAVQGIDRVSRAYKDNPIGAVANSIVAVTIPTLLLYSLNREDPNYQQLSEATKSRYYCIPKGDGTFIKIVKPRESGTAFGTLIEDALDYMKTNDPKTFESFMLGIETNFFPPTRPLWAAATTDLEANKDFAKRPIVPGYLEGLSPELQYDVNTSEPAKWLGDKTGLSPKQIDYVGKSYLGVVGQLGQPLTTKGIDLGESLKRQFVVDPLYSNDVFKNFYETQAELDQGYKDAKTLGKPEPDRQKRLKFNRASDKLNDIRKEMRSIENMQGINEERRRKKLDELQAKMVRTAQEAMGK